MTFDHYLIELDALLQRYIHAVIRVTIGDQRLLSPQIARFWHDFPNDFDFQVEIGHIHEVLCDLDKSVKKGEAFPKELGPDAFELEDETLRQQLVVLKDNVKAQVGKQLADWSEDGKQLSNGHASLTELRSWIDNYSSVLRPLGGEFLKHPDERLFCDGGEIIPLPSEPGCTSMPCEGPLPRWQSQVLVLFGGQKVWEKGLVREPIFLVKRKTQLAVPSDAVAFVNGKRADDDYVCQDGDWIEFRDKPELERVVPPDRICLRFDRKNGLVFLNDKLIRVGNETGVIILEILWENRGNWMNSVEILTKDKLLEGVRVDREIRSLPSPLSLLIQKEKGKGYRLWTEIPIQFPPD